MLMGFVFELFSSFDSGVVSSMLIGFVFASPGRVVMLNKKYFLSCFLRHFVIFSQV